MLLSFLVPVYDEAATLQVALDRLLAVHYPCAVEVVAVDDGSTDATPALLAARGDALCVLTHGVNRLFGVQRGAVAGRVRVPLAARSMRSR